MTNRSKKAAKKTRKNAAIRARQAINGSVFRIQTPPGSLRRSAGLFPDQLASLSYSSLRSAQRWTREKKAPKSIEALLQFRALGAIEDPAFKGWFFSKGQLVAPNGVSVTPGLIEGLTLVHQQNRWQRLRMAELEAKIRRLDEAVDHWRQKSGQIAAANEG